MELHGEPFKPIKQVKRIPKKEFVFQQGFSLSPYLIPCCRDSLVRQYFSVSVQLISTKIKFAYVFLTFVLLYYPSMFLIVNFSCINRAKKLC